MFGRRKSLIFLLLIFSTFLCSSILRAERWSRKSINSLPDFAFASVEYRSDGQKVRHLPQHDHTGKLDLPHLWSALARINQGKWVDSKNEAGPWLHLEANVREYKRELSEHG